MSYKQKEFRWEFIDIGQGHYFKSLGKCYSEAYKASKEKPAYPILLEMFKPKRLKLIVIQNGEEM